MQAGGSGKCPQAGTVEACRNGKRGKTSSFFHFCKKRNNNSRRRKRERRRGRGVGVANYIVSFAVWQMSQRVGSIHLVCRIAAFINSLMTPSTHHRRHLQTFRTPISHGPLFAPPQVHQTILMNFPIATVVWHLVFTFGLWIKYRTLDIAKVCFVYTTFARLNGSTKEVWFFGTKCCGQWNAFRRMVWCCVCSRWHSGCGWWCEPSALAQAHTRTHTQDTIRSYVCGVVTRWV